MAVSIVSLGKLSDGREVKKISLKNANDVEASFADLGAIWTEMKVRDKDENLRDVVLGYDTVEALSTNSGHLGAPIGRFANRIAGGEYTLNGKSYQLEKNNMNVNNLHSAPKFWERRTWDFETGEEENGSYVRFSLHSPDMEQGFPGNLDINITYTLSDDDALSIRYEAVTEEDTLVNLTNHAYFNLEGHDSLDILGQRVQIFADAYTPADASSIPTGEIRKVDNTAFDFREEKAIAQDINVDDQQLLWGNGYDHNYCLNGTVGELRLVAKAFAEKSGIEMEVYTDLEGMQFYTGNGLHVTDESGKNHTNYPARAGYCFETQHFPDAIHHENFISPILRAGERYESETVYRFTLREEG